MTGNVAKGFKWLLEIDGIDAMLIQEVTLPDVDVNVIELGRGVNQTNIKVPGKKKVGTLKCKKLIPTDAVEAWAYLWLNAAMKSPRAGYAKFAFLILLADDGITPIRKYDLGEIFPMKISTESLSRTDEKELYETVEFAVTEFELEGSQV